MKKLSDIEYLKKKYSEKKQYLSEIIGNNELRMIGKVQQIYDTFCKVSNIRTINKEGENDLFIPFEDGQCIIEILSSGMISKELQTKNINEGDIIFFNLTPNTKSYEAVGKYFTIQENSTIVAEDCEKFYKSIELEKDHAKIFNNFSKDNKNNKIYFGKDLIKANEDILAQIKERKQERNTIEEELKKISKDLSNVEETYKLRIKEIEDTLEEKKKKKEQELKEKFEIEKKIKLNEIKNLEDTVIKLKRYNILSYEDEISVSVNEERIYKEDVLDRVNHIQGYLMLNNKKNLYYDENIIKSFYAGLKTEQIIVLAGKPGSGKTSIVEGFADAIGAELFLVPVQPNWMDKSDLLGFYNPIEKNYVSTPFLDVLIKASKEAEKNSNKIFFICLDEMNLSHVEYYFSEFLSKLQTDRKIQLYSQNIYEDIKEELNERYFKFNTDIKNLSIENFLKDHSGENIENYFKLKKQFKMLSRYPYEINIPQNIKFLGTINKDETTKDLSPKVTDRSLIIMLENQLEFNEKKRLFDKFNKKRDEYTKRLKISYKNIEINRTPLEEELEKEIAKIKEHLNKFNISINNRFERTISELLSGESFSDTNEVLDIAISTLILPKFNISSEDVELEEIIEVLLEDICKDKPISRSVLDWMLNYNDDDLTYWR